MHADRDDAPLRRQKKSGIMKWMVALGIGTGITVGMLFVASMNAGKNQLKSALTVTTRTPAEAIQPKPEKKKEIDWDKVVEEQARPSSSTAPNSTRPRSMTGSTAAKSSTTTTTPPRNTTRATTKARTPCCRLVTGVVHCHQPSATRGSSCVLPKSSSVVPAS